MDQIISLAVAEGLWAVLFCGLLIYLLRENRSRESRYNAVIETLGEKLGTLTAVKSDTDEIKSEAEKIKSDTEKIKADTQKIVKLEKSRKDGAACATA